MIKRSFIGYFFLFLIACQNERTKVTNDNNFQEVSPIDHGIDFTNDLHYSPELNIIEYLYFNNGGGVAIGDLDNDGLEDIFLTANQKSDQLYKNNGELSFENISEKAGISNDVSWSSGVTIDDVNGDGWNDIYVCKVAPVSGESVHNELYINNKNGTFSERATDFGLAFSGYSTQASFFDFDNDGDLDVYLLNHSVHSTKSYGPISKRGEVDLLSGDRLYENKLNEGINKFEDITTKSGIYSSALGYGLGIVTSDLNGDGWVDIYVGNDFHENDYLYLNNGDGTFKESINEVMTHTSQFTMGVDAADINGDGSVDLFTTDMMPYEANIKMKSGGDDTEQIVKIKKDFGYLNQYSRNMLQLNNSDDSYSEQGLAKGIFATDWSWSVLLQDFDNSGTTDVFISNGIINRPNDLDYITYINTPENRQKEGEANAEFNKRLINEMPTLKIRNVLFSQSSDHTFTDVKSSGIGKSNYSNGSAYADLDKDGDLDIVSNNINGPISLYINNSENSHFVAFDLGNQKNAQVEVFAKGKSQKKEYLTTRGYQSSSTHFLHFGLGSIDKIDSVKIYWPDRKAQIETNILIDQYVKIDKATELNNITFTANDKSKYELSVLPIKHVENEYDDTDHEPLLPYKLSQEGPASIFLDFNNDGFKDLILGGAKNESMSYYEGSKNVPFVKKKIPDFMSDSRYEDLDMASLDFNKDGLKDIYVVSGGNEYNELDENLQDRIYMNDGEGGFYRLKISLPHTNGSCIAVADFDNDGYEDFFVGSRNVPGAFGVSPVSFIIKNVQGQRLEIVHKARFGMVTDAAWSDMNDNGDKELIITGEWMPLKVLSFTNDSIVDIRESLGIPDQRGLFRCIEIADVNEDGQQDVLLGNMGFNTSLSIGPQEKLSLYLSDFDKNTFIDPIIFNDFFGVTVPLADKATLQGQMPSVKKIFPSYRQFSQFSTIEKLKDKNVAMDEKYINTLVSVVLISHGEDYKSVDLPQPCQNSNISDMYWHESRDGKSQLLYVGNTKANTHVLGQSLSSQGGVLSEFDKQNSQFTSHESLNLPIGTVSKKIIPFKKDQFLILNNDDVQFLLSEY